MTIDDLAAASQQEFLAIRHDMATKEELKDAKGEILRAIDKIDVHLSAYASRWSEDFARLHDWVQELDERLKFLEKTQERKTAT